MTGCGEPDVSYKGLSLKRPPVQQVTSRDISDFIERLREQAAKSEPLAPANKVRNGHRVYIDFVGTLGGSPFQGGSMYGYALVLGSKQMIPGFEEGIVGMRPGESRTIDVTFPADYHELSLAGKEVQFRIVLRRAELLIRPPLDDSLAVSVSGGRIETLSQLRDRAKEQIYQNRLQRAEMQLRNQAIEALLAQWPKNPSKREVSKELDRVVQQQLQQASRQGMGPAQGGPDAENIRAQSRPAVVKSLKFQKIIRQIAGQEDIQVSDAELEQAAEQMAQMQGQNSTEFLKYLQDNDLMELLRLRIMEERVMSLVLQNALIEEAAAAS